MEVMVNDHQFRPPWHSSLDDCTYQMPDGRKCGLVRDAHGLVHLPTGGSVRSDLERAYERIKELEDRERENARHFQTVWDQLAEQKLLRDANEERIRELERENQQLKDNMKAVMVGDSLVHAENERLTQRLNNLDTLAREVSARVEKMTSALDR